MTEHEDRYAIVLGGTGAIGAEVVALLASASMPVAFSYHSDAARAAEVAGVVESHGVASLSRQVDGRDPAAVAGFVQESSETLGRLAAVVYASSPHATQTFLSKVDPERFSSHLQQDVGAFFNLMSATLPQLRETQGAVVAVTTVATRRYPVRDGLSAGPKGAVEALVRAFAAEEGRFGVRVNAVGPGILTDGVGRRVQESGEFDDQSQKAALARIPMRRFGRAAEVAKLIAYLLSDDAAYITGQKVDVDGGYSL